jgi:Zn-dependent protease
VRVLPWFWLMAAFLGIDLLRDGPLYLFIWMVVVFVSILVHELGHALTAEALGCPSSIVMYHFGGLAFHNPGWNYTRRVRMLITAAGPLAGLALFGIVYGILYANFHLDFIPIEWLRSDPFRVAVLSLIYVNLVWSLFNLLPVYPLDGGHLCREICLHFNRINGDRVAAFISMAVGIATAAIVAIRFQMAYAALMLAFMAFQSYQQLQER